MMTGKVKIRSPLVVLPNGKSVRYGAELDWQWDESLVNGRSIVWLEKPEAEQDDDLELDELSYQELRELAVERGVKGSGKKANLIARIAETY